MKTFYKILVMASAAAAAISCAKEVNESSESVQKRILEAYVSKYYPNAVKSQSGLYIIDSLPGTGRTPEDTSYVLVDYTITYLNGMYSGYTSDTIAKQLGEYSYSGFYDPQIWSMSGSTSGIREIMGRMKEGGRMKAIVPAVLLDTESGTEISQGEGSSLIYDIRLHEVIDDIDQYQIDLIEAYLSAKLPVITDSTAYGFYYHKYVSNPDDSLSSNEALKIRYIGRFLNGTVFDTNIEDTAKKYRIYTSGSTYSASTYNYYSDSADAMEENSFIDGFNKALYGMKHGEQAVTVFYSNLGYGNNGSGSIPGYIPLRFDLWVEPEEEVNAD